MKDVFGSYHPFVGFLYFAYVIGISMFLMHPIYLAISLVGAMVYACLLTGWTKTLKGFLLFTLPLMVIVSLINPMFNHYGVTILFYLFNDNAVTLESLVYGLCMALMLCCVITWFRCFNEVMTSDKLIYLFGRLIPSLSLILSMCMRFLPRFQKRSEVISNGQKCVGRDLSNGTLVEKMQHGVTILSILVTWSLEQAILTADSMKARGYGLKKRTAYSIYRMDQRDRILLLVMAALAGVFLLGCSSGCAYADYDPRIVITGIPLTIRSFVTMVSYGAFVLMPMGLSLIDYYYWKKIRSGINKEKVGSFRLWEVES